MPAKKPQRNSPCPCGSGKKFKKCCLAKVEEAREVLASGQEVHSRFLTAKRGFDNWTKLRDCKRS